MKDLQRSNDQKIVAGVCGGIAESLSMDANLVRLIFVVSMLLPGPQILLYLAGWLLMPTSEGGSLLSRQFGSRR